MDEVGGAAAHGFDGEFDVAPGGHDDDGGGDAGGAEVLEDVEALLAGGGVAGVIEVHEHEIEGVILGGAQEGGGPVDGDGAVAGSFEEEAEGFEDVELIVGDEDAEGSRGGLGAGHNEVGTRGV